MVHCNKKQNDPLLDLQWVDVLWRISIEAHLLTLEFKLYRDLEGVSCQLAFFDGWNP